MKTGIKILITMFATMVVCVLLLTASAVIPTDLIQKQSENGRQGTVLNGRQGTVLCLPLYIVKHMETWDRGDREPSPVSY